MLYAITLSVLGVFSVSASAATFTFNTDPFAGSTALTTPGRQVVGNELFVPAFNLATDVFAFDPAVFNAGTSLTLANNVVGNLPSGGANVIVLQTTDNDNNPGTGFGAGNAADLIAAQVTQPGAGFFIYMNSALSVRRLVYSTDLNDPAADLKILARLEQPTGADAIATLPSFTAANFALTTADTSVPEPATFALLGLALVAGAAYRRTAVR